MGNDERGVGTDDAVRGDHVTLTAIDPDDPAREQTLSGVRGELGLQPSSQP